MTALTPRQRYINSKLQLWYEFRVNMDQLAVALAKVGMDTARPSGRVRAG